MTERRCVDCKHFELRAAPEGLARCGFGYCPVRSMNRGHTFSAVRPMLCEKFVAAKPETAAQRLAWLKKQGAV